MSREIIIDVKANSDDAMKNIVAFKNEMEKLRAENRNYQKTLKKLHEKQAEGAELTKEEIKTLDTQRTAFENNLIEIQKLNRGIRDNQKIVAENITTVKDSAGSIREMRTEVSSLTVQWENLSKTEREGEIGQELQANLADLNGKINEASLSTNNFKDNIGNYRSALGGLIGNNTAAGKTFQLLEKYGNQASNVLGDKVVKGVGKVDRSMWKLAKHPLILLVMGLVVIITTIIKAIKDSEIAMDSLGRVMAPIKDGFDIIFDNIKKIAEFIVKPIELFAKWIGLLDSAATRSLDLKRQLEEEEIDLIRSRAKEELRISELENEQRKRSKYTHEERMAMAKEIEALRMKQAEEEERRAKMAYEAWQLETKLTRNKRADDKKGAELEAKVFEAQTNKNRQLTRQVRLIEQLTGEVEAERKAEADAIQKSIEDRRRQATERLKLEKMTLQEIQDLALEVMADGEEKELQVAEMRWAREVERVKEQLATNENLTEISRGNLNQKLELLEEQHQQAVSEIKKKYADIQDEAYIENVMKLFEEGEAETEAQIALNLKKQADAAELRLEQRRLELDNEMLLKIEMAEAQNQMLLGLDEDAKLAMFETQEAYELAVIESNRRVADAHGEASMAAWEAANNQMLAVGAIAGTLSGMLSDLAGESQAMAAFAKTLAVVEIATNMAVGIAGAVKAGAGLVFPANLGAIASGVAAVTSGIMAARNLLKAQVPEPPTILKGAGGISGSGRRSVTIPAVPTGQTSVNIPLVGDLGSIESQAKRDFDRLRAEISVVEIYDTMEKIKLKETMAFE